MGFIKYTEKGRSFAPKVSLSRTGMISFNDGARRRFGMDDFKLCVLYYDPETHQIGVELTNEEGAEGVRKLRLRSTGADIAAKSFIDYFQIPVESTNIYEITRDPQNNLLVFDLDKGRKRSRMQTSGVEAELNKDIEE